MKKEYSYTKEDVVLGLITLALRLALRTLITCGIVSTLTANFGSQLGIIGGMLISWGLYAIVIGALNGVMNEAVGFDESFNDSSLLIVANIIEYYDNERSSKAP